MAEPRCGDSYKLIRGTVKFGAIFTAIGKFKMAKRTAAYQLTADNFDVDDEEKEEKNVRNYLILSC